MKTCTKCQAAKPTEDYYTHTSSADRHMSECKQCFKARMQATSDKRRARKLSTEEQLCKS